MSSSLNLNTTNVSVQFDIGVDIELMFAYLNTTNVSVQYTYKCIVRNIGAGFKYNKCIGSMSILGVKDTMQPIFKYNKCIGSILYTLYQSLSLLYI